MLVVRKADETFEVTDMDLELEDSDPDAVYVIRPLTRTKITEIEKANSTSKWNKVTHQRETVLDEEQSIIDKLDYILVDWRGIVDQSGAAVPCSRDNKVAAISGRRQMALFRKADINYSDRSAKESSFREPKKVRGVVDGQLADARVLSTD